MTRAAANSDDVGQQRIWRVDELNAAVRRLLETTHASIWIEGELSNLRAFAGSGHWYFTLKSASAQVAAAMFRSRNQRVKFRPEDGMQVLVRGQVSVYEPRGTYQLIVSRLEPRGAGALSVAFEQLKARLAAEGLFDTARKRPLPSLPRRIGVVTSADGAAIRDILKVLARRHSGVSVLLVPTRVQGEGAGAEIAAAVRRAGSRDDLEVLIVGRGGGSLEDLWAFNDEQLARSIASCPLPVISAVGHEVDVTIADLVADARAPTPSAAAEMVVAHRDEMARRVSSLIRRLAGSLRLVLARLRAGSAARFGVSAARLVAGRLRREVQRVDEATSRFQAAALRLVGGQRRRLDRVAARLSPVLVSREVRRRRQQLDELDRRLTPALRRLISDRRQRMRSLAGRLAALSPLAVLERGYAVARAADSGAIIRDARSVEDGARFWVQLARGRLEARVLSRDRTDPSTGRESS